MLHVLESPDVRSDGHAEVGDLAHDAVADALATEEALPIGTHPVPASLRTHLVAIALAIAFVALSLSGSPPDLGAGTDDAPAPAEVARP